MLLEACKGEVRILYSDAGGKVYHFRRVTADLPFDVVFEVVVVIANDCLWMTFVILYRLL